MNQIIVNKENNKKKKYFFKVLISICVIVALIITVNIIINKNIEKRFEKLSSIMDSNLKISNLYNKANMNKIYLGKLYIDKINLEYIVFNNYSDELLKIAPCKFYDRNGSIAIAGHNYDDSRFFGKLNKLEINDKIILEENNIKYCYTVFNIYETDENDLSILDSSYDYELTLLTCNNVNGKRLIVKSYMNRD